MSGGSETQRSGPSPDDEGFRDWMAVRLTGLRRKAYLLSGDWHAADDLVQDTLIAVFAAWPRVARGSNIDGYANRVLVHKFIDDKRRSWRRIRLVEEVPDAPDSTAASAFEHVEDGDGPLADALAALSAEQRAVLVLRYTEDLAIGEIARLLGLPIGTVKSRLARGADAARAHLEQREEFAAPHAQRTNASPEPKDGP